MANETKAEKKAAKKAKKAEKKANRNEEVTKSVISSITAVACVIAIVLTSLTITDKVCETNEKIAGGNGTAAAGNAPTDDPFAGDFVADDNGGSAGDNGGVADDNGGVADDNGGTVADDNGGTAGDNGGNSGSNNSGKGDNTNTGGNKGETAPVGNDIAKIVDYYNKAANATKAYTGTMKLDITKGATTKITETSFPNAAKDIANKMLPNDYPKTESFTVTNGKSGNNSISKMLPIEGNAKMSTLSASGVASATCVKGSGGLYKVTIKLKEENVNSFNKQPANHSSCMACLDMTDDDLKPFTCENCNICYTGGTITAIVNDKGLLTGFDAYNPMHITGTLKWTAIKGTATIDASWRRTVKFSY